MAIREVISKLSIGAAAILMAATFINCSLDSSGVKAQWRFWCADYTGIVVDGYTTYDLQSNFAEPFPVPVANGRGCVCISNSEALDLEVFNLPSDYKLGDEVLAPTHESVLSSVRDQVHAMAREMCKWNAKQTAATADGIYSEDIHLTLDNCNGNDPTDPDDPEDPVSAAGTPIYSVYNTQCHGPWKGSPRSSTASALVLSSTAASGQKHNVIVLDRKEVLAVASDISGLIERERIMLVPADDRKGFKIYDPTGNRLVEMIGLQRDDVMVSINGLPLMTASQGIEAVRKLRGANEFRLVISRDGKEVFKHYELR